jgi:hypothetical protein
MSRTVVVLVATASVLETVPVGVGAGGILVSIAGVGDQTLSAAPYTATFQNVPDGDYVVSAQAKGSDGSNLGAAISQQFSVVTPPNTIQVDEPQSVTVTMQ